MNDDELYHYGRSKKDGAPGVGTGNWRRYNVSHWGERTSQYSGDLLNKKARKRYIKGASRAAAEQLLKTIGSTSTVTKQQNRYLRWARANHARSQNKDLDKRGKLAKKEILARESEAKFYQKALHGTFHQMKQFSDKGVPNKFYNEDIIAQAFNKVYDLQVIEPAWNRFNTAINYARNRGESGDEHFEAFTSDPKVMKRYGYSETVSDEATALNLTMEELAYAEYLLSKNKI